MDSALVGLDWTIETSSNATKTNAASSSSGSQPQREPLEIVERSLATYRIQRTWMKAPSINNSCEDIKVFFLGDRFNYVSAGSCNVFDEAVETFIAEAYSLASLPASTC